MGLCRLYCDLNNRVVLVRYANGSIIQVFRSSLYCIVAKLVLILCRLKRERNTCRDDIVFFFLVNFFHPIRFVDMNGFISNLLESFLHAWVDPLQVVGVRQVQVLLDGFLNNNIKIYFGHPAASISSAISRSLGWSDLHGGWGASWALHRWCGRCHFCQCSVVVRWRCMGGMCCCLLHTF